MNLNIHDYTEKTYKGDHSPLGSRKEKKERKVGTIIPGLVLNERILSPLQDGAMGDLKEHQSLLLIS